LQPGHLLRRIGVKQPRKFTAILVHEAFPVREPRNAVALAGMKAVVLHTGQDEIGLREACVLQQAAPEAGIEIRQKHLGCRERRNRSDVDAVPAHLIQIVPQGQRRVRMREDLEPGVLMGLDRPPESAAHVLAVQIDVAPGGCQFPNAGRHVPGWRGQDELGAVLQLQAFLVQQNVLGAAADVENETGLGCHADAP
jgi:hypothetical protein